jgi:hypothetical protein
MDHWDGGCTFRSGVPMHMERCAPHAISSRSVMTQRRLRRPGCGRVSSQHDRVLVICRELQTSMSSRHHFAPLHYILWLLLLYVQETGRHELFGYLSGSGLTHLLHILRVVENSVQLQNSAGGDPLIFLEFQ